MAIEVRSAAASDVYKSQATQAVADFGAHMSPLGVLRAADVMAAGDQAPDGARTVLSTLPLAEIIRLLNDGDAALAVTNAAGAPVGVIRTGDVVSVP